MCVVKQRFTRFLFEELLPLILSFSSTTQTSIYRWNIYYCPISNHLIHAKAFMKMSKYPNVHGKLCGCICVWLKLVSHQNGKYINLDTVNRINWDFPLLPLLQCFLLNLLLIIEMDFSTENNHHFPNIEWRSST